MHSMTGFGRGSAATDAWQAGVEISAVNRKQAEVVVQAPRELNELDARIRKAVLAVVSRGRIQVSINVERAQGAAADFRIDPALALAFSNAFTELGKTVGYPVLPTASDFLRQPGIIAAGDSEIDAEAAWLAVEPALTDCARPTRRHARVRRQSSQVRFPRPPRHAWFPSPGKSPPRLPAARSASANCSTSASATPALSSIPPTNAWSRKSRSSPTAAM